MRFIALSILVAGCGSSAGHAAQNGGNGDSGTGGSGSGGKGTIDAASGGATSGGTTGSGGTAGSGGVKGSGGHGGAVPVPPVPGTPVPSVFGNGKPEAGRWRNITPTSIDPTKNPCTDLQFDPSTPSTLYALFGDGGGVWRSTDSAATWVEIGDLPKPNSLGRILVDPNNALHLYTTGSVTAGSLGFWVSHDGGLTWKVPPAFEAGSGTTWNNDVYNIAADPTDFNHILLTFHYGWACCDNNAGVLESKDGGDSYIVHNPPAGMDHGQGIAFLYDPATSQGNADTWLVGAGYGDGIFRTADAGKTWTKVSPIQENHGGFEAHYTKQGYVYIGARDGILRSTDNGLTWTSNNTGLPGGWYYTAISDGKFLYTSEAFVGQPSNQPFVVTPEGGPNEGQTWTPYNDQVFAEGPWKMTFEPTVRIIYNAGWGAGAWALNVKP